MIDRLIRGLAGMFHRNRSSSASSDAELEEARALLEQDRREEVVVRLTAFLVRHPEHAEAHFLRGTALLELERAAQALPAIEHALRLNPREPLYRYNLAVAHFQLGDEKLALENCMIAVENANFPLAHTLWSRIELPGDIYLAQMQRIHEYLKPRTYLEVGVFSGQSLRLANPRTRTIGIDPVPQLAQPAGPMQTIHSITSDEFFAQHDVIAELGGERVQLAFIDGLHQFEYALRDFVNIERVSNPDSVILIHDCYPLDRKTASRKCETIFWSGDVWRLIPLLKKYRPDLSVKVIATPPTGLGLIQRLDPSSRVLSDRMDELVAEFMALDYSILDEDKAAILNRYPNEWPRIEELIRPAVRP